ncbi:hypothetical protein [Streptomyces sp. McG3]|uniref:hypothetical protein n=1 Tax=Streptomyces sp. McG3 TaxID=2725483 RepID=UPI001BE6965C|nr:hypothetical protein [Streptomyces sp. McG3]MBT2896654.1 hypothetical protein [Streptomyces sp. McG3]
MAEGSTAVGQLLQGFDEMNLPASVLFSAAALDTFLEAASDVYDRITPCDPLPCFAVLLGTGDREQWFVEDVAFGENVRGVHPSAREEFQESIVPRFGPAYENPVRAWWLDPQDLLRITREGENGGLDVLGSIHMHPDWHRIGPEAARAHPLDEQPTEMDAYVFRNTAWPVNVVCYLQRDDGIYCYALSAWDADCRAVALRLRRPARVPGIGDDRA